MCWAHIHFAQDDVNRAAALAQDDGMCSACVLTTTRYVGALAQDAGARDHTQNNQQ